MIRVGLKARLAAAGAVALAMAACDQRSGQVDAPEPAPLADLSSMNALPPAEPARVEYREPAQGYAWAERAYGLQRAVYDAPPDYGFDYAGEEPMVWETADDWAMYAEPTGAGYRYYYYEPGADHPYFVRDNSYGYGYGPGGVLVAVFDSGGRYLASDWAHRSAPAAGRYYARGRELRAAAARAHRVRIDDQAWVQRAPQVSRGADPWLRAARNDGDWRRWRDRDQDRELRRFEPEAQRRAVVARQWRERVDRREIAQVGVEDSQRRREADVRRAQDENQRQRFEVDRQAREQVQRQAQQQRFAAQTEQRARQEGRRQAQQAEQAQQRRDQLARQQGEQHRQQAERQQAQQAQRQRREQVAQQQRQQAERRQQADRQRQQAQQAQQQQREQIARRQGEQRRQQAERQQAQQQRQQGEQRRQQAEQQRQQAQQQRQQQAAQQQAQRQQQQQARAAEQQGRNAAAREQGPRPDHGPGRGGGRGHERKD